MDSGPLTVSQVPTSLAPLVTLATAHPSKFRDAVERAVGVRPSLPPRVGDLFGREEHFTDLAGDYEATRDFVMDKAVR